MVNIHERSPVPACVPAHPVPSSSISPDDWRRLEGATFSVMCKIHPTVSSQHLRARVIDYVQRLFRLHHDGYQVISFGSVPLKTYLPDGDIDLTLLCAAISDENLENEVCAILKSEEQMKDSEFEVKDVKYVPAEVKLVKCKVQNIAVDISVNQIGGPNKVYFLEKVDQNLGKNNLLRRSIMLIKHWCYYESCILGAQRGLVSTYALETLVLYIFHVFHKSLDGPLAVLYRFLDYYSKFDWDNKGISLFGPISLSSLPELVTEPPYTRDDGFLSREAFLRDCAKAFSVPPINSEENPQVFSKKFVNIVDPLKQSNNLGRSISKGNLGRIRKEFYFGACKLGKILQAPACFSANEINRFFRNTLSRADVPVSSPDDVLQAASVSASPGNKGVEGVSKGSSPNNSCDVLCNQFGYIKISDSNNALQNLVVDRPA